MSEGWRAEKKLTALLRLIAEDGTTGRGEVPADHAAALLDLGPDESDRAAEIADAHRDGNAPPGRGGGG